MSRNSYLGGMKTTVSEKGQVTIPKKLRDRFGIRPGDVLDVVEERGRLVVHKAAPEDPFAELYGIVSLGESTDAFLAEIRGEAGAGR
jgi:AbrB family looped-hinge helix DNA binding protein